MKIRIAMRSIIFVCLLFSSALFIPRSAWAQQTASASRASEAALSPVRIILVGDSTVAVNSGWGTGFCADMVREVTCINLAKNGRSSASYRAEGLWTSVIDALKHREGYTATYVLIQFGHNDQPGKPGRSTDLATEFPVNMGRYVDEVVAAGARPVLITPLTRRQFKDGELQDGLAPWADAVKLVAAKQHVPLLDLHGESLTAVRSMGPAQADTLAQAPVPPGGGSASGTSVPAPQPAVQASAAGADAQSNGPVALRFDYTHLGEKGSAFFGKMVAAELTHAIPELQSYVIQSDSRRGAF